ncbi:MAG: uracil phosphoribosyltransferase [Ignavibacteria bacterium RBG_13_36_8]|nr:MAG: uracil phosphoribosyltransferase [Ignavibacteria bacterium RBG_13_36_8]
MNNQHIIDNPLIKREITILRDKNTNEYQFRLALKRITSVLAIEISRNFELEEFEVQTPLEKTKGYKFKHPIVIVPVLRAGLSMASSFLEVITEAKVGHIGLQRDEKTLQPIDYYYKTPKNLDISKVIVLDPMLATGGSASAAIKYLKEKGANNCTLACIISAPEGIKRMEQDHPDVPIYTAVLDRQLNEKGFILPGLGDAGDRTFGTF